MSSSFWGSTFNFRKPKPAISPTSTGSTDSLQLPRSTHKASGSSIPAHNGRSQSHAAVNTSSHDAALPALPATPTPAPQPSVGQSGSTGEHADVQRDAPNHTHHPKAKRASFKAELNTAGSRSPQKDPRSHGTQTISSGEKDDLPTKKGTNSAAGSGTKRRSAEHPQNTTSNLNEVPRPTPPNDMGTSPQHATNVKQVATTLEGNVPAQVSTSNQSKTASREKVESTRGQVSDGPGGGTPNTIASGSNSAPLLATPHPAETNSPHSEVTPSNSKAQDSTTSYAIVPTSPVAPSSEQEISPTHKEQTLPSRVEFPTSRFTSGTKPNPVEAQLHPTGGVPASPPLSRHSKGNKQKPVARKAGLNSADTWLSDNLGSPNIETTASGDSKDLPSTKHEIESPADSPQGQSSEQPPNPTSGSHAVPSLNPPNDTLGSSEIDAKPVATSPEVTVLVPASTQHQSKKASEMGKPILTETRFPEKETSSIFETQDDNELYSTPPVSPVAPSREQQTGTTHSSQTPPSKVEFPTSGQQGAIISGNNSDPVEAQVHTTAVVSARAPLDVQGESQRQVSAGELGLPEKTTTALRNELRDNDKDAGTQPQDATTLDQTKTTIAHRGKRDSELAIAPPPTPLNDKPESEAMQMTMADANNTSQITTVPGETMIGHAEVYTPPAEQMPVEKLDEKSQSRLSRLNPFTKSAKAEEVDATTISAADILIAVMGPTGSGKSSFISKATGFQGGVGHDLKSCTSKVTAIKFSLPEISDNDLIFVDTPGFDDTNLPDSKILEMISDWLNQSYGRGIRLNGLLYFHRISDNRMAGTPLKNLRLFQKICGTGFDNVIMTTTMWDEVEQEEGEAREKELTENYWRSMIKGGSQVRRFYHTQESAFHVIQPMIDQANKEHAEQLQKEMEELGNALSKPKQLKKGSLLIQHEITEDKKGLSDTQAGKTLFMDLQKLVEKHQDILGRIRKDLKDPELSPEDLQVLMADYQKVANDLNKTTSEMQTMATSKGVGVGKRLTKLAATRRNFTNFVQKFNIFRRTKATSIEVG